jgi:peptidoglycan hydrolase CwlO-like protein
VASVLEEESQVQERIAKLESDVSFIRSDISEMKTEAREFRKEMQKFQEDTLKSFAEIRHALTKEVLSTRIWMLTIAAAVLGVMTHGFKWI